MIDMIKNILSIDKNKKARNLDKMDFEERLDYYKNNDTNIEFGYDNRHNIFFV